MHTLTLETTESTKAAHNSKSTESIGPTESTQSTESTESIKNTDNLKRNNRIYFKHRKTQDQFLRNPLARSATNKYYSDNDMVALLRPDRSSRAPRNDNPKVFSLSLAPDQSVNRSSSQGGVVVLELCRGEVHRAMSSRFEVVAGSTIKNTIT